MNGSAFNIFTNQQINNSNKINDSMNNNLNPMNLFFPPNLISNNINTINKFPIYNYLDIDIYNLLFQKYKNLFLSNQQNKFQFPIEKKEKESRKNNYFLIGKKKKRNEKLCTKCPHINEPHYAKGMCSNCYHSKGRSKKPWNCSHINKSHYALGLCQNCYQIQYIKKQNIENKIVKDENNINTIKDNNSIKSIKNDEIDGKVHINMEKYYVNKK
jgi:hypothetical protein